MKKIIITSQNPVKIDTVKDSFMTVFPDEEFEFISMSANSGVSDQPKGREETLLGAQNRIIHGKEIHNDADFYVGIEGGIEKIDGDWVTLAWIVVHDNTGRESKSHSSCHPLPPSIQKLLDDGVDLGRASDIIFDEKNSKEKQGTIGLLTNNAVTRKDYYVQPLIFALVPFNKKDLFERN